MPSVIDHLRVVLRSKVPMQEDEALAELEAFRSSPAQIDYANITQYPLDAGPFEVVAIYSLKPPGIDSTKDVPRSAIQVIGHAVKSALKKVTDRLPRFLLYAQMLHYGLPAVVRFNAWRLTLDRAVEVAMHTDVNYSAMFTLFTMCVAHKRHRQGLGTSVMNLVKQDVVNSQGIGILGFCQSEATRLFYEKQGFVSKDILTHPLADLMHSGIRKEFLVVWKVEVNQDD